MSKIVNFPEQKSKDKVLQLSAARHRNVLDLADHRRKLIEIQREVQRMKRKMLRLVKDHESDDGSKR